MCKRGRRAHRIEEAQVEARHADAALDELRHLLRAALRPDRRHDLGAPARTRKNTSHEEWGSSEEQPLHRLFCPGGGISDADKRHP